MNDDLRRLAADLSKAAADAPRKASLAIRKTSADITATAQTLVPVDTGATQNSIGADISDSGLTAVIGPTTEYSPHLEYGTARMPPRPFMGPAADRAAPGFVAAMQQIGAQL